MTDAEGRPLCRVGSIRDIHQSKQQERLQSLSAEVLGILNNPQALPDVAQGILTAIKCETGFDAVNLRLRQDGDFQYRGADGFSKSFLQAENSLAAHAPDGEICLDENGNVRLECACGLVFPGQADLDNPLSALGESVWTNDAQSVPRVQDDHYHRLNNSCNRCIHEGFQSVALIPVRAKQEIIGLLQFNDRRKNCFDLEMIRFFEGIASSFGIALQRQREEQVLRESQSNLSSLFDAISESVFLMDTEGIVLAANATFAERLGKRPEECVGNSVYSLIPSEASAQRREWVAEVIRTHKPVVYEDERAGRFLRHSVCPVQSMDNPVKRVVVFAIDVTDLKKAEQALRQSEEEFRTMFELASVGMAQADINTGQMLRVNEQMCAITGYSPEEMLGMRIRDFTHPEDQQRDWDMFQKVIRGEIPDYHIEKRYVRKNGAVTWANVNSTAIRDAAGHPLRTIATIEDITERKRLEQELRGQHKLLASIIEGTAVGTWRWNVQTGQTQFNERWAEIVGYTLAELAPINIQTWLSLAHPDDLKDSEVLLQKHFEGSLNYYDCECRMRHKNGSWVWVQDRGKVAEWADDGKPLIMTGTHADITRRKQAEHEIRRLNEELEERVVERTAQLDDTILQLRREICERQQAEERVPLFHCG